MEELEEITGPSLALIDGIVCMFDVNGVKHATRHPELFNVEGGVIGRLENEVEAIIAAYGSEELVKTRAIEAENQWGIPFPQDIESYGLWHVAALTCP